MRGILYLNYEDSSFMCHPWRSSREKYKEQLVFICKIGLGLLLSEYYWMLLQFLSKIVLLWLGQIAKKLYDIPVNWIVL